MVKVAILGGGIGGLTVAHHLSDFPEYEITIYEAKSDIGGLARSARDKNGCATEYCWRVLFGFYDNFFGVLDKIPLGNLTSKDHLTVYKHTNVMEELTLQDKVSGYSSIIKGLASCDKRLDDMDKLSWWQALGTASNSNLFREIGGWLGMDRYKGSYKSVIKVGIEQQIVPSYLSSDYKDYVTTKPTSEAIFDPWYEHLLSKGVKIHTNTPIDSISIKKDFVISASAKGSHIDADYYILNLPVEVLEPMLRKARIDETKFNLRNLTRLKEECLHTQLSFQLYFNRPVSLGDKNAFLLVDSPWDLIVLSYDAIYDVEICYRLPNVKGAWSVAVCTSYSPGILYKKGMSECSEEEIKEELWAQLSQSKKLQELITKNNEFSLEPKIVAGWADIWPTYDKNGSALYKDLPVARTTEPKFTNNAGSYELRPSFKMYIKNAYISTAYIKETIDIFSMEAAVIAGKRVAKDIDSRSPSPTIRSRPVISSPFRAVDQVLYSIGLPNVVITMLIVIIVIMFIYLIYNGRKK